MEKDIPLHKILEREDVIRYMNRLKAETYINYLHRVFKKTSFFHSINPFQWVFHREALKKIKTRFDITENEFIVLLAFDAGSRAYNMHGYVKASVVYNDVLNKTMSSTQFYYATRCLVKKDFLIKTPTSKMKSIETRTRKKLKTYWNKYRGSVYYSNHRTRELLRLYKENLSKEYNEFIHKFPEYGEDIIEQYKYIIFNYHDLNPAPSLGFIKKIEKIIISYFLRLNDENAIKRVEKKIGQNIKNNYTFEKPLNSENGET